MAEDARQAGIEVTPEMIEAGAESLASLLDISLHLARVAVVEVYSSTLTVNLRTELGRPSEGTLSPNMNSDK